MNLEPIIQSEASQKENNKYLILTLSNSKYIWNLKKIINHTEEFIYRATMRNRHREETYGMGRGEERVRCRETVT